MHANAVPKTAQISTRTFLLIFVVATGLKLLLLPAYRSTDFEVHRNWLAVTGTLPVSQWYLEETSEWTLDYPPFFAWFEFLLAQGAPLFDRGMLTISATPYASSATVAYQRLTVIGTDALLFVGARRLVLAEGGGPDSGAAAAFALCCLDAGLLLVDHVHFQYNGMMVGLLLLSVAELRANPNPNPNPNPDPDPDPDPNPTPNPTPNPSHWLLTLTRWPSCAPGVQCAAAFSSPYCSSSSTSSSSQRLSTSSSYCAGVVAVAIVVVVAVAIVVVE